MEASERYKPKCRNKPARNLLNSVRCMIKMLYCTGMQVSEASYSIYNGRVARGNVYNYFRRFLAPAGIQHKGTGFGPRLHGLRVTFAVHALLQLDSKSIDINACLYYLSVYMGHKSLHETQEYLWLTGELFHPLLDRIEAYTAFVSDIFNEKAGGPDYE